MKNFKELCKKVKKIAKSNLSESRFEHSVRTAKMCKKMCRIYGEDFEKGYFCGISHDICKNFSEEEMKKLALQNSEGINQTESENFSLLHGKAAAVFLKNELEIVDEEILEAVSVHTFGKIGMKNLSKILFIADKIEPGRPYVTKKYIKKLLKKTLDELVLIVLENNVSYLEKKGKKVAQETFDLLNSLKKAGD